MPAQNNFPPFARWMERLLAATVRAAREAAAARPVTPAIGLIALGAAIRESAPFPADPCARLFKRQWRALRRHVRREGPRRLRGERGRAGTDECAMLMIEAVHRTLRRAFE